jgi:hypothetical protein
MSVYRISADTVQSSHPFHTATHRTLELTKDAFGFLFSNANRPSCSDLLFERNLLIQNSRLLLTAYVPFRRLNGSNWKEDIQIKETKDYRTDGRTEYYRRSFKLEAMLKSALGLPYCCSRRVSPLRHTTPNSVPTCRLTAVDLTGNEIVH